MIQTDSNLATNVVNSALGNARSISCLECLCPDEGDICNADARSRSNNRIGRRRIAPISCVVNRRSCRDTSYCHRLRLKIKASRWTKARRCYLVTNRKIHNGCRHVGIGSGAVA